MRSIKVELEQKTITISKLPLKRYADLLRGVRELPKHVKNFDQLGSDTIVEILPTLIADCMPDIVSIITVATDLTAEEVENMGLDEVTKVVLAVVEVNNYQEIFNSIKKARARLELPATAPRGGTGGQ